MSCTLPAPVGEPAINGLLPWSVSRDHLHSAIMPRLDSFARRARGAVLEQGELDDLLGWFDELEAADEVLAYHPDAPGNRVFPLGGFSYVKRTVEPEGQFWAEPLRSAAAHEAPLPSVLDLTRRLEALPVDLREAAISHLLGLELAAMQRGAAA